MQVSVEVSPQVQRQAEQRGIAVGDFLRHLIEVGLASLGPAGHGGPDHLGSAMDRIRALRFGEALSPEHRD